MYLERFNTLARAYRAEARNNAAYEEAMSSLAKHRLELRYIQGLEGALQKLSALIVGKESEWQDKVLRMLEAEIMEYLSIVYPNDGYVVQLSCRVLRGKVHVDAKVTSYFASTMPWSVADTQGRLFQQIVSFAALECVMRILGADTIYVDEAFSGSSEENVQLVNRLLMAAQSKGRNVIMIAQNHAVAAGIDANVLYIERSIDNKTTVQQAGGT